MYKILIITGEPSGDNLGSKLIKEMKIQFDEKVDSKNFQNKKLLFQGIGGPKMQNEGFVCLCIATTIQRGERVRWDSRGNRERRETDRESER